MSLRDKRELTPRPPSFLGHALPEGEGLKNGNSGPLPEEEGGERTEPGEGYRPNISEQSRATKDLRICLAL